MKKPIRLNSEQYKLIKKTDETARGIIQSIVYYRMTKDEQLRSLFFDISPHGSLDLIVLQEMDMEDNRLIVKDNNIVCMYIKEVAYIEGAFLANGIFRIMNLDVFSSFRGRGIGSRLLEDFMNQIQQWYPVFAFNVLAQNQYAKEGEEDYYNNKLVEFYGKSNFISTPWGTELVKPVSNLRLSKEHILNVLSESLEEYYSTRKLYEPKQYAPHMQVNILD